MTAPIKQVTFAGGEISPFLAARVDNAIYEKSLKTLRNMITMRQGGVTGRPGSMYVGTTLNGGNQVRLIPFIFNETGLGQSYVLEFGNLYIAFYQNGGVVTAAGVPYTIVSPYAQADLATLKFAESADVVTITHPSYAPRELRRLAATNWTISAITFSAPLAGPTGLVFNGFAGGLNFGYIITSVNQNGEESDSLNASGGLATGYTVLAPSATTPINVKWNSVTGAVSYRVYRCQITLIAGISRSGPVGFVGQVAASPFVDYGASIDYTNLYPQNTLAFNTANNYPSTVGFVQQRRVFAATNNNPIGFWASVPGDFSNFSTHILPQDSDAIFSTIAGEEVNAIQHVLELKFMLMLTSGAEIYVQGNGNGVVTPASINASVQSQYGCAPLRPLKVGDIMLFNQALGSFIRDFAFDFAIDGYRGNDITVFASHLFEGYQLDDWAYQKTPDSLIWAVRSDGVLLCCTYVREQQVLAWSRHDFTNGVVENICAIPENGEYALYLSIKRVINGATVRYIERLSSRIWTYPTEGVYELYDPINATYLDCWAKYDGVNNTATTMRLMLHASGALTITGVAIATNSVIITVGAHNLNTYDQVSISGVVGTTQLNGNVYTITFIDSTHFSLTNTDGSLIETSGFGTYVSGGTAQPVFSTAVSAYQQQLDMDCSIPYFGVTAQVGDQIFLENALFKSSQAVEGAQVRFTVQTVISATRARVTASGLVPAEFQDVLLTTWSRAVQTVTGLDYLAGQEVSVWADRYVVGSPLNYHVDTVYTVSLTGTLTLDKPYAIICVGLPMIQDVETLNRETAFGEDITATRRRSAKLALYMLRTRTLFAGSENPDTNLQNVDDVTLFQLYELMNGTSQVVYDQPPKLETAEDYIITEAHWNKNGRLFMRNVDPVPLTILSISVHGDSKAPSPNYERV